MVETKDADRIVISSLLKKEKYGEAQAEQLLDYAKKAIGDFDKLYKDIEDIWNKYINLTFPENINKILYTELNLVLESGNAAKIDLTKYDILDLYDIHNLYKEIKNHCTNKSKVELLTETEAKKIYIEYPSDCRTNNYTQIVCVNSSGEIGVLTKSLGFIKMYTEQNTGLMFGITLKNRLYNNISSARVPVCYHFSPESSKLDVLLKNDLIPEQLSERKLMNNLIFLYKKRYISIKEDKIKLTSIGEKAIIDGSLKKIGNTDFTKVKIKISDDIYSDLDLEKLDVENKKKLFKYYLICDKLRANMSEYDLKRLEDPNLGHWELWDENVSPEAIKITSKNRVIARNPEADIQNDSLIGIDFGTKSTVVVYQDESGKIKPMPIGCCDIRKVLEKSDFENPTVMQLIDIDNFIKDYSKITGRPATKWNDLMVSHAANESMKDTGIRSDEFYSYIYDLKQWAGEKNKKNIIRDKKGTTFLLKAFSELCENDSNNISLDNIDPIELYAYFIGLYVNNMNNGIFLEYLLSFPVTYEKQIRDMIIKSFKRGLWKSLPKSIQNNKDIAEKFKVEAGTSEPAAYAICALEQYGFDPEENENVFYGIFDFGGGTTDFDFGLWTCSDNEDIYDYKIEHFGAEGDRYLGGENLLQLIAFEVFKENIDICRKEKITFDKPLEYSDVPVELKGYVNDSQEARINLKLMMEKLRPFWERNEEDNDVKEFEEFQISLFNTDGILKSNLAFEVDVIKLENILKQRISKGVRQFFNALKSAFGESYIQKTASIDHVNIFLAGNSSKSPLLKDIFAENIKEWNKNISQKENEDDSFFTLFPPLGSKEAFEIQSNHGINNIDELEAPNGKTGVAWGIIEGRKGGRIEVIEEITANSEAKFAYYLGISKKKKFSMKISRDTQYSVWSKFIPAVQEKFEILYTSLPEATNGNLSESDEGVLRKRLEIKEYGDNLFIFIKLTGVNQIEYAVGKDENSISEENVIKITL